MNTKLRLVLSITILFLSFYGSAQQGYWKQAAGGMETLPSAEQKVRGDDVRVFTLSESEFRDNLQQLRTARNSNLVLQIPGKQGEMTRFRVRENPVLAPSLSAKYPGIRSFIGYSLDNEHERIRFSFSHKGFQGMIIGTDEKKTVFLEKIRGSANKYLLYNRDDLSEQDQEFLCYTEDEFSKQQGKTFKLVDEGQLRTFRIAVSASGEYTQYHGGTIEDALAAINATLTTVNEVFETDFAVHLELIADTDLVIYADPDKDPYGANLNVEVQNTLSSLIGEEDYDVGHLFHRDNDSGNAGFIGSVCKDNQKGSAYSAALVPQGPVYDLDFVSHELGHQFGANHTWSFESEGTLVQAEPGSGTTIMGYAGIVAGNNVQRNGDDYFHYYSILQVINYLKTVSCGTLTALTNNPPVITPSGDFVIPKSTAFVLTGTATDPDPADVLTYAWEQIDNGVVTALTFGPTNPGGANFRSRPPGTDPSRYFPRLTEVVQGNLTQSNPEIDSAWETVSSIERELNFALTVRDNAEGGGQVASDLVKVSVSGDAGPFTVLSQASSQAYQSGSVQTINWDVAGTSSGEINAQTVDIYLSVDGGLTYPFQLADAVPNDGTHDVLLPGVATTEGRFMVKADNNIFFAINAADFSILESQFVLAFDALTFEVCQPADLQIPFDYYSFGGFNEEVTFSTSGLPTELTTVFTPPTVMTDSTAVTLDISNINGVATGTYPFTVTGTSASLSRSIALELRVLNDTYADITLNSPLDGATGTSVQVPLEWAADPGNSSYELEIASDSGFSNIVETAEVIFPSYLPQNLVPSETYFWRVKGKNSCGEGSFSSAFSFSTIAISCKSKTATGLPLNISPSGTPTITSSVTFLEDLPVSDVDVSLDIDHTFLGDLIISLQSPGGTTVVLVSNSCGEFRNMEAVFDDDGETLVCGNNPAISGRVKPLGSLSSFNGESIVGTWTLTVYDSAPADGGALNSFTLDMCVEGEFRPDADGDGIFDDGDDQCLGTPPGVEVDTDGCAVYRLPQDNFRLSVDSESCINSDDGRLFVTAEAMLDYQVTVVGNGVNESSSFTSNYELGSLAAGTYELCIQATDGPIEYEVYCFEAVVSEPLPLSVLSQLNADGSRLELKLEGAELYNVEVNGLISQVTTDNYSIALKEGNNVIKVFTNKSCQGVYEEEIFVPGPDLVYPNPFFNHTAIYVG
uniref:reprolysin-like metallopeptidase n=1 Tax=Zeaxanthinibacter enoshimensis TaxID=392009 RepID=UPI003563D0CD